jgi:FdhD protein
MKTKSITISKVHDDSILETVQDTIINESPLQIVIGYGNINNRKKENLSVTMRTQGDDFNLVIGFLFCEGIIKKASDIISIEQAASVNTGEDSVLVELSPEILFNPNEKKRNFIASSACGFCGKSMNDIMITNTSKINNDIKIQAAVLYDLPASLQSSQGLFSETGGAHSVALANKNGEIIYISEDVGRHNAMDKMVGAMLMQNIVPLKNNIILFSGRLSYELVQKSIAAGIPLICSIGAPTTLAIELAEQNSITVVGFLKNKSFNIYCGTERIIQ